MHPAFALLPDPLIRALKRTRYLGRRWAGSRRLRQQVQTCHPLRIVVGSEGVVESGWVRTEIEYLNVLRQSDWAMYFAPNSIHSILAEHVWEHLTFDEGLSASRMCHEYLQPGGRLRIAVPDGFHPDPAYIDWVKVGGRGAGADDHKTLYNHGTLSQVLTEAGFRVELLEYFDAGGAFHAVDWRPTEGMVCRSARFDDRNAGGPLRYTSLIIDAHKPQAIRSSIRVP